MAKRINIHKSARKVHLFASLVLIAFIAFFFASGWIMLRAKWFPEGEIITSVETLPLNLGFETDSISFGKELQKEYELYGRMDNPIRLWDGRWHFMYTRPGRSKMAILNHAMDSVQITTKQNTSTVRVINRLHHLRAYKGNFRNKLWALFIDLTTISMMLFAITGFMIWFKMRNIHRYGWIFFGIGVFVVVSVFLFQYFSP